MKKKYIIIAAIVMAVLIIGAIVGIVTYRSYTRVLQDTDYPVTYKIKDGVINLSIKDKTGSKVAWTAVSEDEDFVTVAVKGKAKSDKAKFVITPKKAGLTTVRFTKSYDAGGVNIDKISVEFPVYVSESLEGLKVQIIDKGSIANGYEVIGSGTNYPVVLCGTNDASEMQERGILGNIDFIKGKNDWEVKSESGNVILNEFEDENEEGRVFMFIDYAEAQEQMADDSTPADATPLSELLDEDDSVVGVTESDAVYDSTSTDAEAINEEVGSDVLTFSSSSLGITVKKKVTVYSDGLIAFTSADDK